MLAKLVLISSRLGMILMCSKQNPHHLHLHCKQKRWNFSSCLGSYDSAATVGSSASQERTITKDLVFFLHPEVAKNFAGFFKCIFSLGLVLTSFSVSFVTLKSQGGTSTPRSEAVKAVVILITPAVNLIALTCSQGSTVSRSCDCYPWGWQLCNPSKASERWR